MSKLKIMVYNTQHCKNYLKGVIDYPMFIDLLKDFDCDVVGLNEIRGKGDHAGYDPQTEILAEGAGYPYYKFAQAILVNGSLPYGNALISRIPLAKTEVISVPDPIERKYKDYYETRCLLKAKLECGLTVMVIHFGLNPDERENAVKTILENLEDERCIVMGDFNSEPDDPIIAPLLEKLYDTSRLFDEAKLSFPSDKPEIKIDYVLATKDVKVVSADIPAIVGSDHRPYVVEIEI